MKPALEKIKKIAIYGGAFDPPHKGHLGIIHELANIDFLDQVWILPSGDRTDKKLLLNMEQRSKLIQQLTDNVCAKKVTVCFQEIKLSQEQKRMIPTMQLFGYLQKKYQDSQFFFTVGGDILSTINTWEEYQQLLNTINFIIFPRRGYSLDERYLPKNYYLSPYIPEEISSSFVKNTLLSQQLTKQQKSQKVSNFLQNKTIEILKKRNYL